MSCARVTRGGQIPAISRWRPVCSSGSRLGLPAVLFVFRVECVVTHPRHARKTSPADRGGVGEDPDAEDDDHAGGELRTDAQLVAQEDDQCGHDHVREERDHEDLVHEDPVEHGPQATEDGVESGNHRDREVGLDHRRHFGPDQQSDHDSHDEAQYGDHDVPFPASAAPLPVSAAL